MSGFLVVPCPDCRSKVKLAAEALGNPLRCPKCARIFRVKPKGLDSPSGASPTGASGKLPVVHVQVPAPETLPPAGPACSLSPGSSGTVPRLPVPPAATGSPSPGGDSSGTVPKLPAPELTNPVERAGAAELAAVVAGTESTSGGAASVTVPAASAPTAPATPPTVAEAPKPDAGSSSRDSVSRLIRLPSVVGPVTGSAFGPASTTAQPVPQSGQATAAPALSAPATPPAAGPATVPDPTPAVSSGQVAAFVALGAAPGAASGPASSPISLVVPAAPAPTIVAASASPPVPATPAPVSGEPAAPRVVTVASDPSVQLSGEEEALSGPGGSKAGDEPALEVDDEEDENEEDIPVAEVVPAPSGSHSSIRAGSRSGSVAASAGQSGVAPSATSGSGAGFRSGSRSSMGTAGSQSGAMSGQMSAAMSGSASAVRSGSMVGAARGAPADPLIGRVLGGYRLTGLLGRGGRGVVYSAEDQMLGRPAAVKLLAPEVVLADPSAAERFLLEARAAAKLDHPNIVGIYAVGRDGDVVFTAMAMVRGCSLADEIDRRGRLPALEAVRIIRLSAKGLGAAHKGGVVHRDVKPGNILLGEDGTVKVADFGLAKIVDEVLSMLTEAGKAVGTPQYMSPEQCRGEQVDARADVYALGATFFHALTGQPPFTGNNAAVIARAHLSVPPPDPRSLAPDVPAPCVKVIERALAKRADQRFADAAEFAAALRALEDQLLRSEVAVAPPAPAPAIAGQGAAVGAAAQGPDAVPLEAVGRPGGFPGSPSGSKSGSALTGQPAGPAQIKTGLFAAAGDDDSVVPGWSPAGVHSGKLRIGFADPGATSAVPGRTSLPGMSAPGAATPTGQARSAAGRPPAPGASSPDAPSAPPSDGNSGTGDAGAGNAGTGSGGTGNTVVLDEDAVLAMLNSPSSDDLPAARQLARPPAGRPRNAGDLGSGSGSNVRALQSGPVGRGSSSINASITPGGNQGSGAGNAPTTAPGTGGPPSSTGLAAASGVRSVTGRGIVSSMSSSLSAEWVLSANPASPAKSAPRAGAARPVPMTGDPVPAAARALDAVPVDSQVNIEIDAGAPEDAGDVPTADTARPSAAAVPLTLRLHFADTVSARRALEKLDPDVRASARKLIFPVGSGSTAHAVLEVAFRASAERGFDTAKKLVAAGGRLESAVSDDPAARAWLKARTAWIGDGR